MAAGPMQREAAELVGLQLLGWMAGQDDVVARFLAATGADAADLRARAREPDFLGFVLDYLLADEAALLAACADLDLPPDAPARARASLPGGDLPHWT